MRYLTDEHNVAGREWIWKSLVPLVADVWLVCLAHTIDHICAVIYRDYLSYSSATQVQTPSKASPSNDIAARNPGVVDV